MRMLFISSQNVVEEVDVNDNQIREKIGGWMEIVRPVGLPGYCLIVDEEGLLKQKLFNLYGSYWYGYYRHNAPIVGDILVSKLDEPGNLISLTPEDVIHIKDRIRIIPTLFSDKITGYLTGRFKCEQENRSAAFRGGDSLPDDDGKGE